MPKLKYNIDVTKMIKDLEKVTWYHKMKFGGYTTDNYRETFQEQKTKILSKSFKDKTVLDIGCANGYYGFLAEDMKASKVLMTDNENRYQVNLALKYYDTKVKYKVLDVYDLDKLDIQFDVILFLGLFFHIAHPLYALEIIYKRLKPGGKLWLETMTKNLEDKRFCMTPKLEAEYPWWDCTLNCIYRMLEYAKYKNVKMMGTFNEEDRNTYYLFNMNREAV